MNRNSTLPVALSLLGLGVALAPPAPADAWDKKTFVTFSQSVEIPGTVLPAGKYVFKLADSPADRHIVRIMNERENQVFATILAIPSYRERTPDHTLFTFYEMPAGQPEALKEWFYPGDNYGQEFAYSKKRSAELALMVRNKETVTEVPQPAIAATIAAPETDDQKAAVAETTSESAAVATSPTETASEEVNAEPPAPSDDGEDNAEPAPAPEPPPQAPSTPADANNDLPKTASQVFLTGLVGLLATLGAFGVREYRRAQQ